jgi:hypothetical protein
MADSSMAAVNEENERPSTPGLWSIPTSPLRPLVGVSILALTYMVLALRLAPRQFVGDEASYIDLATNLAHGYFSPPGQIKLWWGPGYPLVLVPFLALHIPLLAARLLNVVFMLGAVVLTYRAARLFVPGPVAAMIAAYIAVYVATTQQVAELLSEPLTLLLVSAWMYLFCKAEVQVVQDRPGTRTRWWTLAASAAVLAYLALTKVFFGWVIMASLASTVCLLVVKRSPVFRRWVAVFALALLLCGPYLAYTYTLTGRLLYWGTSGGLSLYWMATPYPGELGDWFSLAAMRDDPRLNPAHARLFASIDGLNQLQQDDALRAAALDNIRNQPGKYVQNWVDDVGRLVINFPYSFTPFNLRSVAVAVLNAPAVLLVLAALALVARHRGSTPLSLRAVALVAAIAFFGSSLLSAYLRQFLPLVPWLTVAASATVWPTVHRYVPVPLLQWTARVRKLVECW